MAVGVGFPAKGQMYYVSPIQGVCVCVSMCVYVCVCMPGVVSLPAAVLVVALAVELVGREHGEDALL